MILIRDNKATGDWTHAFAASSVGAVWAAVVSWSLHTPALAVVAAVLCPVLLFLATRFVVRFDATGITVPDGLKGRRIRVEEIDHVGHGRDAMGPVAAQNVYVVTTSGERVPALNEFAPLRLVGPTPAQAAAVIGERLARPVR